MMNYVLMIAALLLTADVAPDPMQEFVVVVNASNPVTEMTKDAVSKIFLKRQEKWSNGETIVPVDLGKGSPVRDTFSKAVHGRPTTAIVAHWQQQIFSGKDVPPADRDSDADALAMVRANPNAITYVAAGTQLGAGLKVVTIK